MKLKLIAKTITAAKDAAKVKELLKAVQSGDSTSAAKLKKELKPLHAEIIKDFDKSATAFMKDELARLKKAYPDFKIGMSTTGKRSYQGVSGNSDSQFGDWFDPLDYRFTIHLK